MRSAPLVLASALVCFAAACGDNLEVGADSLVVNRPSVTIGVGESANVAAVYSVDGALTPADDVTWTSSNPNTATVSGAGATAVITGVATGSATVTATGRGGLTATVAVAVTPNAGLVSIQVEPTNPSIADGTTVQLVATGTFDDGSTMNLTTLATWTSDDTAVATVGTQGLVTGQDPGDANISASFAGTSGSTTVTVTSATLLSIAVTPANSTTPLGVDVQFTATGTFSDTTTQDLTASAAWQSSDEAVATIDAAGLATPVGTGTTEVKAMFGGISGTTNLTVSAATLVSIDITPVDPSVALGVDQQFTATGTFSDTTTADITNQVTWDSTDTGVATISNIAGSEGLASTVGTGTTTISATSGTIGQMTSLTVTDATLVSIQVTPVNPSVALGVDPQFTATGTFSDTTTADITAQVTWASTDTGVATISNVAGSEGAATTVGTGTTTISATSGTVSGTTDLTVTTATLVSIAVTPVDPTTALGVDEQFTATGTFSDTTTSDITTQVTWASTDTGVATISNAAGSEGLATPAGAGTTTISATQGTVSGSTTLTVTTATLVSITVTPVNPSVALGVDPQFTATGHYSDTSTLDITTQVTWASTDTTVATISNVAGSEGLADTQGTGTTTISATSGTVSGTTDLTVTPATLVSIAVTPPTANLITGDTQQYTATGTFTDTTTANITTQVTWASVPTTVAQISNAAGSEGLATAVGGGTATITAMQGAITSPGVTLNVTARPTVVSTTPADGAGNVSVGTTIAVTFSTAMAPASLTGQTAAGACTGTIQLSGNGFTSCLAFTTAAPTMSGGDTVATLTPAAALGAGATYKIRVLGTVQDAGGISMGTDYTQTTGFTTATGVCATSVIISQIYGGGGNAGSVFNNDFIELHNTGTTAVSLTGMAVQYISAAGTTTWSVTVLPVGASIPPGGYYLVQEAAGTNMPGPLPTPDATGTIAMGATAGKVALTSTAVPLVGSCPTLAVVDMVGYGSTATCFEGAGPTGTLTNSTAAVRNFGGCPDGDNAADFSVLTPTPRNSASAANVCSCAINETNAAGEMDFCNLQFPASTTVASGATTELLYARVFETGVTEAPGANPLVVAQIGVGAAGSNPLTTTWTWGAAAFNVQIGNDDEYQRSVVGGAPGNYSYTSRFSLDGVNWTYCDLDGAGSNAGLTFDPALLGALTVTP